MAVLPIDRGFSAEPTAAAQAPDFQEVYDLLREHLAGVTGPELNKTAVHALISSLGPRVALVGNGAEDVQVTGGPSVRSSNMYDGSIACLRISRVEQGLAGAVREACGQMATNLNGIILDLRYAGGNDYGAAAETVDLFVPKERPLMDWGNGLVRSKEKKDAITVPVAILVNGQTRRAAEALAAAMRETGAGLILGGKTAGQAMVAQEFPLKNGQRLRIATAAVQVGETRLLSAEGVKPDITVQVSAADERAWFDDPYKELLRTNVVAGAAGAQVSGTNRVRRVRFNEAELVRERREEMTSNAAPVAARGVEPETPVVQDPVLARALDLLKGLAVVRHARSSFPR